MKDRLKEYIDQNREAFDSLDAPARAWDAIDTQLNGHKHKRLTILRYSSIAVAAALAGIMIYVAVLQPGNTSQVSEVSYMNETELYYSTEVNQKRALVYQMSAQYPELQTEMDNDLAELDTIMAEIKRDLKDNVDNAEVVEAMIQNYRMKLSILEDIMQFLEEQQENNEQTHTSYAL
ncbi:hypothetical protein [Carboxylicivirga sp. RSCT41]|uniref:hypothetical protein n=1 Tax=Carboxylicivirga agarovorans TaxID=3417570 RepID=UPI003D32773A